MRLWSLLLLLVAVVVPVSIESTVMMTKLLMGQRVLITGAGRGIGRAICQICHEQGARVAITSRTLVELEETERLCHQKSDSRDKVYMYVADVTCQDQVASMVTAAVNELGGIDILINNAGGGQETKGPMHALETEDFRRLFELNVVSVQMVTSAVLKHAMLAQGNGRIINISSRAGKIGIPNYSFYCASKFALEGLTASLAEEVHMKGIYVNTLSPGMVDTRSFPKPVGKAGVRTAESIRDGLLLLLDDQTKVTGHYLHVDELDQARERNLNDTEALKPIREATF